MSAPFSLARVVPQARASAAGASPAVGTEPLGGTAPGAGHRFAGRYRLDDLVRTAGGGALWRGRDEVLDRVVAIWALGQGTAVPVEVISAVLAVARICDPRIARIFDADCDADSPYVVTEWPDGEHIDDLLGAGLPGPAAAVAIVAAAASALAIAHESGRHHLCLTPRSVVLGPDGVKILGLGIEAALAGATAADPAAADTRALGWLLYALLTGYWPGPVPTALPPAPRVRGALCSPAQARAGVPRVLDAITRRALLPGHPSPVTTPAGLAAELRAAGRALTRRADLVPGA